MKIMYKISMFLSILMLLTGIYIIIKPDGFVDAQFFLSFLFGIFFFFLAEIIGKENQQTRFNAIVGLCATIVLIGMVLVS